jgi:hypothetical protein
MPSENRSRECQSGRKQTSPKVKSKLVVLGGGRDFEPLSSNKRVWEDEGHEEEEKTTERFIRKILRALFEGKC